MVWLKVPTSRHVSGSAVPGQQRCSAPQIRPAARGAVANGLTPRTSCVSLRCTAPTTVPSGVQQWLLGEVLGIEPLPERPPVPAVSPRRSRAQKWEANLAASRQYRTREGQLNVPRSHIETVDGAELALGVFIANARTRKASLAPERVEELSAVGMRWQRVGERGQLGRGGRRPRTR
ncbi:helicase associated domain-containing protein [Streptomyces sp. T12]|uniref:helicase associated domain-containing protein n=1 Tax=Streptomyces sp. T12 TaxID=477697 RepID=UPI0027D2CBB4|nr:helicase associated domain-containing protein [Streptomyces sp. T12]